MQTPYLGVRMLVIALLSLALIIADYHTSYLDPARRVLNAVLMPVQRAVDMPAVVSEWVGSSLASRRELREENERLKASMLVLKGQVQKMAFLSGELNRLRSLLGASAIVDESVVVAEIIGVNPDPYVQEVIINKGRRADAFVGQPVLDSEGLLGQITEVSEFNSRVLMISDSSHAVPVQVNRNGVRAIAFGTGPAGLLELVNVPETTDIQVGDLLVSSGLGGRFPVGYPVGKVISAEKESGQPFVRIRVQPAAELNRSRHVMLVFKRSAKAESPHAPEEAEESTTDPVAPADQAPAAPVAPPPES